MQQPATTPYTDSVKTTTRPGAIVVGASSGMGEAVARALGKQGYQVALVARSADRLQQVCQEVQAQAGSGLDAPIARAYPFDVCEYTGAQSLFERILADFGGAQQLRTLIYAAGVMPAASGETWSFAQEQAMIETNVIAAMRWISLAAETMRRNGRGTIVGISSVAGDRGRRGNSAYMASKAALSTYLESLRFRLGGTGVRVVTVKPGYVATPMTAGMKLPRPLVISADTAARRIIEVSERGPSVVYVPGYWRLIMSVIRGLPASVLARLPL